MPSLSSEYPIFLDNPETCKLIFEHAPMGIVILDLQGKILHANQYFCEFLGYTQKEVRNFSVGDLDHPDERIHTEKFVDDLLNHRSDRLEVEKRYIGKEGKVRWAKTYGKLVLDQNQKPSYLLAMIENITEQKITRESSQENLELLEKIIATNPNIVYVYDLIEQKPIWQNRYVADQIGYKAHELQELGFKFLPEVVHPEDFPKLLKHFSNIQADKEENVHEIEYRMRHKNGEYIWFISRDTVFKRDDKGEVIQIIGSAVNISNTKKINEELSHSRAHYKSLFEQAGDGVALHDEEGNILDVNEKLCELFNYSKEEFLSLNVYGREKERLHQLSPLGMAYEELKQTGKTRFEGSFSKKGGEEIFTEVSSSFIDLQDKRFVLAIVRDITARKKAEQAQKESEEKFRSVAEGTEAIITLIGLTGKILYVNRVIEGVEKEQLIGSNIYDWLNPEQETDFRYTIEEIVQSKQAIKDESDYVDPHGNPHHFINEMNPIIEDGVVVGIAIISNEVTEVKTLSAELERAQFCIDNTLDGIILHNKQGEVIYANQACADFVQTKVENLVGTHITEFDNKLDNQGWESIWNKIRKEKHVLMERTLDGKEGTQTIIENSAKHTIFNGQELIVTFSRDITERKKIEEDLRKSEARFRSVVEGTDSTITLLDTAGVIQYVNKSLPGVNKEDYIGTKIFDWYCNEDSDKFKDLIKKVSKTQTPATMETTFTNEFGRIFYLYHVIGPMLVHNEVTGISIISNDITEVKQLQKALDKNTELMTLGMEAAEMGTWEWDMQKGGKISCDNTLHKIYGWEPGTWDGTFEDFLACVVEADRKKLRKLFEHAYQKEDQFGSSHRIIRKNDHAMVWVSFKCRVFRDTKGKAILMRAVEWDSTKEMELELERKKAKELQIQNEHLRQFSYLASHDLRSPLITIGNFVDLFERQYTTKLDDRAQQYMGFIKGGVARMKNFIADLLDYSRLGENKDLVHFESEEILSDVLRNLKLEIQSSGAKIIYEGLPIVKGFKTEFTLLLQNLVSNAIKFRNTGTVPKIVIQASEKDAHWNFSVKDNGIGIEPAYKHKVFEIFKRLHSQREYPGTGIGLAHCKKIVELHGGEIGFNSEVGKGTTFYFSISKAL